MYFNFLLDIVFTTLTFAVVAVNINSYRSDFIFTNTIAVFLFGASIVSFLISFNTFLGRIFIYLFYLFNLLYFIYLFFNKKINFRFLSQTFLFAFLLIFTFFIYIYYSINYEFLYNGHDPYFFSIPFEISESLYNSRLKIFDNFPMVWSKYHFFHGSFYSFFTIFAFTKNVFLFKAVKIFTFFLLYKSLNEIVYKNKLALFSFFICSLTLFTSQTSWFLYSNGILSLYLLVCSISYIHYGRRYLTIIFILFLANSSVRTFIPSVSVLVLYLIINKPKFKNIKKYLLPSLILISASSMVLSGNINSDYSSLASFGNITFDFIYSSWFKQLTFYKLSSILVIKPYLSFAVLCISLVLIPYLLIKKRYILNFIILAILLIINFISINFLSNYFWIANLINLLFLSFIIFVNKRFISKSIFYISLTYILASYLQLIIIPPDSAIVNIMLVELLVFSFIFYIFLNKLSYYFNKMISTMMIFLACIMIFRATYRYGDNDTIKINLSEFDLNKLNNNEIFKYENAKDFKKAAISVSLLGKRVKSSKFIQSKYHVSKQFISDK